MLLLAVSTASAALFCPSGRVNPILRECMTWNSIGPKNTGNLNWWDPMAKAHGYATLSPDALASWDGVTAQAAFGVADALAYEDTVGDLYLDYGSGGYWHASVARDGAGGAYVFWSWHATPTSDMAFGLFYDGYVYWSSGQGEAIWVTTGYTLIDAEGTVLDEVEQIDWVSFDAY